MAIKYMLKSLYLFSVVGGEGVSRVLYFFPAFIAFTAERFCTKRSINFSQKKKKSFTDTAHTLTPHPSSADNEISELT